MEEKKNGDLKFNPIRVLKALLVVFIIFFVLSILLPHRCPTREYAKQIVCMANLKNLSLSYQAYYEDNKLYAYQDWCDILKPYYEEEKYLVCPADPNGPCSYAMNENIPADAKELPGDLVLLFESTPGWNRIGGADDVVTDRHGKPGANIAFTDGHVEFVRAEDIPNLRWTVEQKRGAEATR